MVSWSESAFFFGRVEGNFRDEASKALLMSEGHILAPIFSLIIWL
jgi:hypothetical protein